MSNLSRFLKSNKKVKENTTYPATKSLTDENGDTLLWTIKHLTTKEFDTLRDSCTRDVPVKGKPNMYRPTIDTSKFLAQLICASVVEPNLNDKDLQDSYGVMSADELILEMIDDPGEYAQFAAYIQQFNGFSSDNFEEKVETAKN